MIIELRDLKALKSIFTNVERSSYVLIQEPEGFFSISPPSGVSPFSKNEISYLEESVSGFIPMNVNRIFDVLKPGRIYSQLFFAILEKYTYY